MLVGSLAIACSEDDNDDLKNEEPKETTESTPTTGKTEGDDKKDSTSTAVPEEIVPVKITATTFPDDKFRALISGRDYDKNGDGT